MKTNKGLRIVRNSLVAIGLVFVLFSFFLVSNSVAALGGIGADCADGGSVYCSGYKCSATEEFVSKVVE